VHNFVGRFLRFVLKLVLAAFGLLFAVSLIAAALIVVMIQLVKALVTGKRPAPAMVFGRLQRFSPEGLWPGTSSKPESKTGDVVDVEVREVREDRQLDSLPTGPKKPF
jgi:hypothetical protein